MVHPDMLALHEEISRLHGVLDAIIAAYEAGATDLDGKTGAARASALAARLYIIARDARKPAVVKGRRTSGRGTDHT